MGVICHTPFSILSTPPRKLNGVRLNGNYSVNNFRKNSSRRMFTAREKN